MGESSDRWPWVAGGARLVKRVCASRWFSRVAYFFNFVVLCTWALIPVGIMGCLHISARSDRLDKWVFSLERWRTIAIVWAVAFTILFVLMLRRFFAEMRNAAVAAKNAAASLETGAISDAREAVREAERKAQVYFLEVMLGMICALSLGFPTIFLGAMPLVATDSPSFWQNYSGNYSVEIPADPVLLEDGPRNFLIAIDVSHSFLGDPGKPGSDQGRIGQIEQILHSLLDDQGDKKGAIRSSFDDDDSIQIELFAEGRDSVDPGIQRTEAGNMAVLHRLVQRLGAC